MQCENHYAPFGLSKLSACVHNSITDERLQWTISEIVIVSAIVKVEVMVVIMIAVVAMAMVVLVVIVVVVVLVVMVMVTVIKMVVVEEVMVAVAMIVMVVVYSNYGGFSFVGSLTVLVCNSITYLNFLGAKWIQPIIWNSAVLT